MVRLDEELKACGLDLAPAEFRDAISDLFNGSYRNWTDEDLVCRPDEAKRYCVLLRHHVNNQSLSDYLILRTLLNIRKGGGLRSVDAA